jgi:hypothetical protein
MPTTVVHRSKECVLPTSYLGGTLPGTSSPICSKDVAGAEAAHSGGEDFNGSGLWTALRGWLRQRVSEEEKSNSTLVIISSCYYCKVHSFCVSGINHCGRYMCIC